MKRSKPVPFFAAEHRFRKTKNIKKPLEYGVCAFQVTPVDPF
jgi:hypothetical protein